MNTFLLKCSNRFNIAISMVILVLVSSCVMHAQTFPISSASNEKTETTVVPLDPLVQHIQTDSPEGVLFFSCVTSGIFQYEFDSENFSGFKDNETRVYKFVEGNEEGVFYTQTTDYITVSGLTNPIGPSDLFLIKPNLSVSKQITQDEYDDFFLSVSPESGQVVYTSDREEPKRYKTVLLDVDSNKEVILYEGDEQSKAFFSPLGDKIAVLYLSEAKENAGLLLFDLNQNTYLELVPEKNLMFAGNILWSLDQKYIVVVVMEEDKSNIEFVNVETGEIDKIITTEDLPYNMVLSPDGNTIFYEMDDYSGGDLDEQINAYLYDIVAEREILFYRGGMDRRSVGYAAAWSPSSDFIVLFILDEDPMNNQKMVIKNLETSEEIIIEVPCGSVSDSIWVASP